MKIDAHQHFWQISRGDYGWLTPEVGEINRDFLPADLAPILKDAGIDGTILVQAAPTAAETQFMLELANQTPFIKGVVGWVDFEAPDAADQIARLAEHPKLVGLRPMIQDIADDAWMLRPALAPAFDAMIAHDLTFDALTLPRHLGHLETLLARHPNLRVVIDHGSKPEIREGKLEGWAKDIAALAQHTTAYCKVSGLVTEAAPDWQTETLKPYVDHLIDSFRPDRLIWGSDWPVCLLASDYPRWNSTTNHLLAHLSQADQDAIRGGNAQRAYKLKF